MIFGLQIADCGLQIGGELIGKEHLISKGAVG